MRILILCIIISLFSITRSYAYIDPGTGSIIFQAIVAFIAAAAATLSLYWSKLKSLFKSKFKKKDKD